MGKLKTKFIHANGVEKKDSYELNGIANDRYLQSNDGTLSHYDSKDFDQTEFGDFCDESVSEIETTWKSDDLENKRGVRFDNEISQIDHFNKPNIKIGCKEKYISWRYTVAGLLHVTFFMAIFMRNCMPIALVCMADPTADGRRNNHSETTHNSTEHHHRKEEYEFDWDISTQSLILSSVQFSSCIGPLAAEMIRQRLGSKFTMTLCGIISAVLTILCPVGARFSPWVLFSIRVLLGISLGSNVSTTADLLAWWSPAMEKQTMTAIAFAGLNIGGIVFASVAGFLCSIPLDNGWPFIFYVFGFLALILTIGCHFLNANQPEKHKFISEKELTFIVHYRTPIDSGAKGKVEKPPYKKIFTSIPVLCYLISGAVQVWSTNLYNTILPNFFVTVNEFTVEETGIIMSAISFARFLGMPVWTIIINKMKTRQISNTTINKIILAAGYLICSGLQIIVIFLDKDQRWVVAALLMVILASQSAGMIVFNVIPMDMAPRYAGFLSGIFYSVGSLVTISGPLMVGALTPNSTKEEWRVVWIIVSCVFIFSLGLFLALSDSSVQQWARVHRYSRPNIQSAFVAMGRRISAVVDGQEIASNGNKHVPYSQGRAVSMTPSGVSVDSTTTLHIDLPHEDFNQRNTGTRSSDSGISNVGFVHDDRIPGLVDKVPNGSPQFDEDDKQVYKRSKHNKESTNSSSKSHVTRF